MILRLYQDVTDTMATIVQSSKSQRVKISKVIRENIKDERTEAALDVFSCLLSGLGPLVGCLPAPLTRVKGARLAEQGCSVTSRARQRLTLAEQGCVKQEERDTTLLGRGCQARCQPNITPSPSSGTPERLALKIGRNSGAFLEVG